MLPKCVDHLCNRRSFLPHCNVDALHIRILLVDDGVNSNGRLTGLPIPDDEFTLAATNWHHTVDGFKTC